MHYETLSLKVNYTTYVLLVPWTTRVPATMLTKETQVLEKPTGISTPIMTKLLIKQIYCNWALK